VDPQTYGGKLRIATGLAILEGILDIDRKLPHLRVPFLLCHGTGDRVTSYKGSQKLYEQAESKDKEIKLYDEVRSELPLSSTHDADEETCG
jgi:acylglycerol lipase